VSFAVLKKQQISSLLRVLLSVISLCLLYLSAAGKFTVSTPVDFMGEPLWFSFSRTPSLLFLAAVLTLWVLLFAGKKDKIRLLRWDAVLLAFALSFGCAAFFSGQFLMRYISLEFVGLIAALSTIGWGEDLISLARFNIVFILLRLGDLSLLISILILWRDSGTLNIEDMIAAAVEFSPDRQIWIIAGVLAAAAIKLAVWPFWSWLRCAEEKKQHLSYWISAILVPSLGMYLLYRFVPIIKSQAVYQTSLAIGGLVLVSIPVFLHLADRARFSQYLIISSILGAMYLFGAAAGSTGVLVLYAWGMIIFRLILIFQNRGDIRIPRVGSLFLLLLVFALPGFLLFQEASTGFSAGWALSAAVIVVGLMGLDLISPDHAALQSPNKNNRMASRKESRAESPANISTRRMDWKPGGTALKQKGSGLPVTFSQAAAWLYSHVEQTFDQQWRGFENLLMRFSTFTLSTIEQSGSDKANSLIRSLVDRIGNQEKRIMENPFRWALIWIPLMLAVVLIIILSSQNG
jgi:hypothetical protein